MFNVLKTALLLRKALMLWIVWLWPYHRICICYQRWSLPAVLRCCGGPQRQTGGDDQTVAGSLNQARRGWVGPPRSTRVDRAGREVGPVAPLGRDRRPGPGEGSVGRRRAGWSRLDHRDIHQRSPASAAVVSRSSCGRYRQRRLCRSVTHPGRGCSSGRLTVVTLIDTRQRLRLTLGSDWSRYSEVRSLERLRPTPRSAAAGLG